MIALGSDHAGYELKELIKEYLQKENKGYEDFGPYNTTRVDYPDYAHKVAFAIKDESCELGIVICGSGNGINMAVNKHFEVRSALCWKAEIAQLAREHNNANVLALPARFITKEEALEMVKIFLNTPFEGGRHQRRVQKITEGLC